MLESLGISAGWAVICLIIIIMLLIGFIYIIRLQKKIIERLDSKDKKQVPAANNLVNLISTEQTEDELVAVIAAAVAAFLGKSVSDITVRSIKSLEPKVPSWAAVGHLEQMNSRF